MMSEPFDLQSALEPSFDVAYLTVGTLLIPNLRRFGRWPEIQGRTPTKEATLTQWLLERLRPAMPLRARLPLEGSPKRSPAFLLMVGGHNHPTWIRQGLLAESYWFRWERRIPRQQLGGVMEMATDADGSLYSGHVARDGSIRALNPVMFYYYRNHTLSYILLPNTATVESASSFDVFDDAIARYYMASPEYAKDKEFADGLRAYTAQRERELQEVRAAETQRYRDLWEKTFDESQGHEAVKMLIAQPRKGPKWARALAATVFGISPLRHYGRFDQASEESRAAILELVAPLWEPAK